MTANITLDRLTLPGLRYFAAPAKRSVSLETAGGNGIARRDLSRTSAGTEGIPG